MWLCGSWRPGRPWGLLPWHPQASAPSCLPRNSICQPGHEAVRWLSDQSCLTGVQGQRATTWLVSVEQQHGSLWKEIPFPLYEASTLTISSPAGTLCSITEDVGVELIAFGSFLHSPASSGQCPFMPSHRGLCLTQPKFTQEGGSG